MDYINYVKQSPITGFAGFGGGVTGLGFLSSAAGPPDVFYGDRGVFCSGSQWAPGWGNSQVIDYINITSTGNATSFGEPTSAGSQWAGTSNTSRGIFTRSNYIDYITIANPGNASDFGDLTNSIDTPTAFAGDTNADRGIICQNNTATNESIQTVTISTTGNSSNFGNMSRSNGSMGGTSNGLRGLMAQTNSPYRNSNEILYLTIATGGSTSNFGQLSTAPRWAVGACSSGYDVNRAVFAGGRNPSYNNVMDYVSFATEGNATDFGDMTSNKAYGRGTNNATRGIFGCYASSSVAVNAIDYITVANTGNASDFGDLTAVRATASASSGD